MKKKHKGSTFITILCVVVTMLAVGLLLVYLSQQTRVKVEVNNWWKVDDQLAISYVVDNNTDIHLQGINFSLRYQTSEDTYGWMQRYVPVEDSYSKGKDHEIIMVDVADWQTYSLVVQVESYVYYPIYTIELETNETSRY